MTDRSGKLDISNLDDELQDFQSDQSSDAISQYSFGSAWSDKIKENISAQVFKVYNQIAQENEINKQVCYCLYVYIAYICVFACLFLITFHCFVSFSAFKQRNMPKKKGKERKNMEAKNKQSQKTMKSKNLKVKQVLRWNFKN